MWTPVLVVFNKSDVLLSENQIHQTLRILMLNGKGRNMPNCWSNVAPLHNLSFVLNVSENNFHDNIQLKQVETQVELHELPLKRVRSGASTGLTFPALHA